ncbi:hypothetical protein WISP_80172 [Willisornis vidua]|uniref:Uncharacterized protein n=1 Tax=Willisornis vidua TaxID=1566151 RepID=A0ABQ9DAP1_9PASS|nr:hypothetical protein WISP_80172 [Willisornis vidua]
MQSETSEDLQELSTYNEREGVDSLEGKETLQKDLNKSGDWAITNHKKFIKGNCQILYLGWDNPGCTYRLRKERLESSATERDLGVLVNGQQAEYESAVLCDMTPQNGLNLCQERCGLDIRKRSSPRGWLS